MYNMLERARKSVNRPIAAMLDTRGPEVRTGKMQQEGVLLKAGSRVTLTPEEVLGNAQRIGVNYKDLARDVAVGQTILIDDGLVSLTLSEKICRMILNARWKNGRGIIKDRKRRTFPPQPFPFLPRRRGPNGFTVGIEMGFDFEAASFFSDAHNLLVY